MFGFYRTHILAPSDELFDALVSGLIAPVHAVEGVQVVNGLFNLLPLLARHPVLL